MASINKLELNWVGKKEEESVEPRILIENSQLSNISKDYGSDNMLIHGDNLLALKALEKNLQVKLSAFILIRHTILDLLLNFMMIIVNLVFGYR